MADRPDEAERADRVSRVIQAIEARGYEMDATGRLSPGSLARVLEHTRWQTLRDEAFGIAPHFQSGLVRAQRMIVEQPISYPDVLRVETWIGRVGRTSFDFVQRVTRVSDGERVAQNATTVVHMGPEGPAPIHDAVREKVVDEGQPEVVPPPTEVPPDAFEHTVVPRWSDQDIFQHVNQSRYIDWLEDARAASDGALPHPSARALRAISIQYDGECRAGQNLLLRAFAVGPEGVLGFELADETGRTLTRARTELG